MARNIDTERLKAVVDCDICHGRKSKNREVYHILSFNEIDDLRSHLTSVFPNTPYCVEFYTTLWVTAHQIYGQRARDLYAPLWLVYLEAHKVKVANRAEAIMKYRGRMTGNSERQSDERND